jgi:tRNA nucleotidyltransferase (CCA-adding enzyme)
MLFSQFEIRVEDNRLSAQVWGEEVDSSKHNPVVEVKAATYTALDVHQDEDGCWVAQCVVDV